MTRRRMTMAGLAAVALVTTLMSGLAGAAAANAAGPTADQLRDRTANCESQVSNGRLAHDAGGDPTVAICASANAVYWTADMDIDCDGQRTAQCNENTDPWFQPDTAWHQSDGLPLNSAELEFVVVPLPSSVWDYADSGLTGGTVVAVVHQDRVAYGVVGDKGPASATGEGSYRLAEALGINPNPATGGVSGAVVTYIAFPGVTADRIEDHPSAVQKGEVAAGQFVDDQREYNFSTWGQDVSVRQDARLSSPLVTSLPGPTNVYVECQKQGDRVEAEGYVNNWWSKLRDQRGFITNIYINHPDAKLPGVPLC